MTRNEKSLSNSALIALYLRLRALRKGALIVKLSKSCIKAFLLRDRLHGSTMWVLANSFKPYFPTVLANEFYKEVYLYLVQLDESFLNDLNSEDINGTIRRIDTFAQIDKNFGIETVNNIPKIREELLRKVELITKEVAEKIKKYQSIVANIL